MHGETVKNTHTNKLKLNNMTTKGDNEDSNPTQNSYSKATTSPGLPWLKTIRTGENTREISYSHFVSTSRILYKAPVHAQRYSYQWQHKSKRVSYLEQSSLYLTNTVVTSGRPSDACLVSWMR
jgi:hypothetical protein